MKVEVFENDKEIYSKTINKDGSEGILYNGTATRLILSKIGEGNVKNIKLKKGKLTFFHGDYFFIIDNYDKFKLNDSLKEFNHTIDLLLNKRKIGLRILKHTSINKKGI